MSSGENPFSGSDNVNCSSLVNANLGACLGDLANLALTLFRAVVAVARAPLALVTALSNLCRIPSALTKSTGVVSFPVDLSSSSS